MNLSHRIQLDPTLKQRRYFAQAAGTARMVWNWALAEWNEQHLMGGNPKANELQRYFNSIKYAKFPWLRDIPCDAHTRPFANLYTAFQRFFSKKGRYPKFKAKGKNRDSVYVHNSRFFVSGCRVRLPLVGFVRMAVGLRFKGKIMGAVVSREADRWFISISVEIPDQKVKTPKGKPVGVDLGLTTFATLSTGEKIEAPKPLARKLRRLRRMNRQHSRKQKGSGNCRKSARRLAKLHWRIRNVRRDFLHKLSTRLCKNHAEVCVEDLNVSGMIRNRCLSKAISDAGWGEFRRQLDYKSRLYGSQLTVRDRFLPSSKTCSMCGHKLDDLPLSVREWDCPACGAHHDRDENAAVNLKNDCVPPARRKRMPVERSALTVELGRETDFVEAGTTTVEALVSSTP